MKYIMIFHANLNYAYLTPEKYEEVIRNSYELIFDTMEKNFPDVPYVFEASGYTIEQMGNRTPDVLNKLKAAIQRGQCEFMGSPYAHPMLPNFPIEDGIWSIRFSDQVYQVYLGLTSKSFWNPECGWRDYLPHQVQACGYKNLIGDFEAYSRSRQPDGKPNRPEIFEKEYSDQPAFYNFGFNYDLPGDERAIHFPFNKIGDLPADALRMFLRTDRVAQFGVRYFMGMTGYTFEAYLDLIKKYSQQPPNEPEGALIIFADDAEYVGTNGWFRLKYQNKPDNVFEKQFDSQQKLIDLVEACAQMGSFCTFDQACTDLPVLAETAWFDDDSAWHGAQASTWASTPMAQLLRPWQQLVRDKLMALEGKIPASQRREAWFRLTTSYNSDGQWPPTLPEAPHIIHPFNYRYCFENLLAAEMMVGGIDRSQLTTSAQETLNQVLSIQQQRVLEKARSLQASTSPDDQQLGMAVEQLIQTSQQPLLDGDAPILYPSEYSLRAEMLVEGRQLVGGIELEKVEE